jgi:hypothetical protein
MRRSSYLGALEEGLSEGDGDGYPNLLKKPEI